MILFTALSSDRQGDTDNETIVGLYEDITDAQNAINDLVRLGFDRADISLVASKPVGRRDRKLTTTEADRRGYRPEPAGDVAAGMATGGWSAGWAAYCWAWVRWLFPASAHRIAGPLVAGLTGAGIGAAVVVLSVR